MLNLYGKLSDHSIKLPFGQIIAFLKEARINCGANYLIFGSCFVLFFLIVGASKNANKESNFGSGQIFQSVWTKYYKVGTNVHSTFQNLKPFFTVLLPFYLTKAVSNLGASALARSLHHHVLMYSTSLATIIAITKPPIRMLFIL